MKILYVTTIGITMNFFKDYIRFLLDKGHSVDIATNETESKVATCYRDWDCKIYQIDTSRSPLSSGNLSAIKQIKKLVENEKYDIVHCHTPIAAMCCRIACRKARKNGTKVIYTAHGFHFYKGAPIKNWILYYPIEKLCSYFTDALVTINQEDYEFAKRRMKAKKVKYVPGVGIDLRKFKRNYEAGQEKRKELGIAENAKLLISVGELNTGKNHETVIRAIADEDICYIIAGEGELKEYLTRLIAEHNMSERVKLLGYRKDVSELCSAADAFVFPSIREGLPVSVMEAMACGLPIACGRIRGNVDLIDEHGGALFNPKSVEECKNAIKNVLKNNTAESGHYNEERAKQYDVNNINAIMYDIYLGELK